MFRPAEFITQSYKQRDWFALSLLAIALTIVAWVVSILFSSTTRELAMRRFHLASPDFVSWAALAPVPSMYNFENRAQFSNELAGELPFDESHESWFSMPLNHFPARVITFGELSPKCFTDQRQGTFEMSTRFRKSELTSRWEILEQSDGSLHIHRSLENWVQHRARE